MLTAAEITTDPAGLGYNYPTNSFQQIADIINTTPRTIIHDRITAQELFELMDFTTVDGLQVSNRKRYDLMIAPVFGGIESVKSRGALFSHITAVFGSPSSTETAYIAATQHEGFRWEELGLSGPVSASQIQALF